MPLLIDRMTKKQEKNYLLREQKHQRLLNKNHDKIKKYIDDGMRISKLCEIYGKQAVNEVLNSHE
jgi:hypothetical protein